MLETFSKFSIFFILFEPSYNIYKTGKSRFCIFLILLLSKKSFFNFFKCEMFSMVLMLL